MSHRALGVLAGLVVVWVGATGAPLPVRLALCGALPALLGALLPTAHRFATLLVQLSAALLLFRPSLNSAGIPVLGAALLLCTAGLVARWDARLVLGVAWTEALRSTLLPVARGQGTSTGLVWLGVASGAATAFSRRQAPWVVVGWTLLGLRGHHARVEPLRGPGHAVALASTGLIDAEDPALWGAPAAGLAAMPSLRQDRLAHALRAQLGVRRLLWAGWYPLHPPPQGAHAETVQVLDSLGRGGEALRYARRGAKVDPELAWWAALLAREQQGLLTGAAPHPPKEVPVLDRTLALNWTFLTEATREQLLHLPSETEGLVVFTEGQSHQGNPTLRVEACGASWLVSVPEGHWRTELRGPLPAGPCRLRVSFLGDRFDDTGDRNATLLSVERRSGVQVFNEK